ncbi:MAG TPA: hypothetical protein VFT51_03020 [Bacillales bacterium]|nr:hypothetical protein [Bacillales bacterium]
MVNKEKEWNNQFKTNENSGEHRNGRLSQMKNHNADDQDSPNEYVNEKRKK